MAPKLSVLLLLVQALFLQRSESFSVKPVSIRGFSKIPTRRHCSQRFLLSCALKSYFDANEISKHTKIASFQVQVEPQISSSQVEPQCAIILDRRSALGSLTAAIALRLQPARAVENTSASITKTAPSEKLFRLSNDKLKAMVESDIRDRQFLVTGQLTRCQLFITMNSTGLDHLFRSIRSASAYKTYAVAALTPVECFVFQIPL